MSKPTEEQVQSGAFRSQELLERFGEEIKAHFQRYEGVPTHHLETDAFTAAAQLFTHVSEASGRPPLFCLQKLAEFMGVQTMLIRLTPKSQCLGFES